MLSARDLRLNGQRGAQEGVSRCISCFIRIMKHLSRFMTVLCAVELFSGEESCAERREWVKSEERGEGGAVGKGTEGG